MINFLKHVWQSFMEIRRERARVLFELNSYRESSAWLSEKLTEKITDFNAALPSEKAIRSSELMLYMNKSASELKNLKNYLTELKKSGRIYYIPINKRKHIDEILSTFDK